MSPVRRSTTRSRAVVLATAAALTLLVAGCSGLSGGSSGADTRDSAAAGGSSGDGVEPAASVGAPQDAGDEAGQGVAAKPGTGVQGRAAATPAVAPKMVRTATISVEVRDVGQAAAAVRAIATGQRGYVVTESIGSKDPVPVVGEQEPLGGFGQLTLSVPAAALDATLTELAKVGTVLSRGTNSSDVTSQYVDTESRLKTMRASVDRVRQLMAQATTIGQVVSLESELSRREADLESLESQLAALKGDVERSTVTVSLSTPAHRAAAEQDGFLAGLAAGWDAFTTSTRGLVTALGAVLPFAVFLALVAAPVLMWWRRRPRRAGAAHPAPVTASRAPDAPAAP